MVIAQPDPDEVDPARPHEAGQPPHPTSLGGIDGVDRVGGSGDGPHLDRDPGPLIEGNQVQLSPSHVEVSG